MERQSKKFHFQEIDWVICFPAEGNAGKYRDYRVLLAERKNGKFLEEKRVKLGDVLDGAEIERHYPHTVGYYKAWCGQEAGTKPQYLELREIRTVEEFWAFLNAANI
jgi:hypothetical protein